VKDYHESSKLVTLFTLEHGKVNCIAKGARRLKSKFGAALDLFARARVIYYWNETRTLYTLSDAELIHASSGLSEPPERFLAAEQMAEFALKALQPSDPSPQLYRLLLNYLSILESLQVAVCSLQSPDSDTLHSAAGINRQERQDSNQDSLQSSSLAPSPQPRSPPPHWAPGGAVILKAASFLGFRPELRRCLICRRPPEKDRAVFFDSARGGIVCARCSGEQPSASRSAQSSIVSRQSPIPVVRLDPASLDILSFLLYTPATEIASLDSAILHSALCTLNSPSFLPSSLPTPSSLLSPLDLVLDFLSHHFDPLVLNSFRWRAGFPV
jgi:recombinational DNA repair protein (RecF pathway)